MSGGVAKALGEAVAGDAGMAEIVQAGLFEELDDADTGSLVAASPLSAALPSTSRKVGRPKGAKNKRTEAVTAWLLQQHRHPLSVMMEAYSMAPADLAERIGLATATKTKRTQRLIGDKVVTDEEEIDTGRYSNDVLLDLLKLQVRMAEAVAPYVAQKMTATAEGGGGASLNLTFAQLNVGGGGVSVPARSDLGETALGGGISVRLGQVGQDKSDGDATG